MKYIRTKDIVFELSYEENGYLYTINGEIGCEPKEVIAQADTIDDLCDEFVWITPEKERHIKPKTGDGLWLLCCNYKNEHKVYGAIWTDKGLIYVAKMNDEGELELL